MQLIDATQWFKPLRKNLGKKNCELSEADIDRIGNTFLEFEGRRDTSPEHSKIFRQRRFRLLKVTVERPIAPR